MYSGSTMENRYPHRKALNRMHATRQRFFRRMGSCIWEQRIIRYMFIQWNRGSRSWNPGLWWTDAKQSIAFTRRKTENCLSARIQEWHWLTKGADVRVSIPIILIVPLTICWWIIRAICGSVPPDWDYWRCANPHLKNYFLRLGRMSSSIRRRSGMDCCFAVRIAGWL